LHCIKIKFKKTHLTDGKIPPLINNDPISLKEIDLKKCENR